MLNKTSTNIYQYIPKKVQEGEEEQIRRRELEQEEGNLSLEEKLRAPFEFCSGTVGVWKCKGERLICLQAVLTLFVCRRRRKPIL